MACIPKTSLKTKDAEERTQTTNTEVGEYIHGKIVVDLQHIYSL